MPQFRKKTVIIEAIKYTGDNKREVQDFTNGEARSNTGRSHLSINTKEGQMICRIGDYIIKEPFDKERNFYPCKPDIFEKTYEIIE